MRKISTRTALDLIATRTPFRTHGNLSAICGTETTGRMAGETKRTFDARREDITYTVYSYGTPIAWYDEQAGWIVPEDSYSVTTTKARNQICRALDQADEDYTEF
jgi:surface antigen